MKVKNGQVILNKAEIERLHMFWGADYQHDVCSTINCKNIKGFTCCECPFNAIDEAMQLVSRLAHNEIRRQERLAERKETDADGQIKMKV